MSCFQLHSHTPLLLRGAKGFEGGARRERKKKKENIQTKGELTCITAE